MSKESKIKDKLNSLFKENQKPSNFEEEFFTPERKMQMEDMTPEEKKEVEDFVRQIEARKPQKPEKFWRWKYTGRILFKSLLLLSEFFILTILISILLPLAINTSIAFGQSFAIALLLTILRQWAK
jgi:sensor histidine kinase YesM